MKCSVCKNNEAIIHIEEFSDNGVRKLNLCLECAAEKGFNVSIEQIDKLLLNFLENIFTNSTDPFSKSNKENALKCSSCGKTIYEVTETQKAGCPVCYTTLKKIIDLMIFKNNNSLTYKGNLPDSLSKIRDHKTKIEDLKIQLNQSLLTEDYTNAANLRDQIRKLKEKYRKIREDNDSRK